MVLAWWIDILHSRNRYSFHVRYLEKFSHLHKTFNAACAHTANLFVLSSFPTPSLLFTSNASAQGPVSFIFFFLPFPVFPSLVICFLRRSWRKGFRFWDPHGITLAGRIQIVCWAWCEVGVKCKGQFINCTLISGCVSSHLQPGWPPVFPSLTEAQLIVP